MIPILSMLKIFLIILAVLVYWKFIYYKYHNSKNGALVLIIPSAISMIVGLYAYSFENIFILYHMFVIYFIILFYYITGIILIYHASKKKGLNNKIDVLSEWVTRVFGRVLFIIGVIIVFPLLLFSVVGTYRIFGFEHIYLWIMIFFAWSRSGIKLFRNCMK